MSISYSVMVDWAIKLYKVYFPTQSVPPLFEKRILLDVVLLSWTAITVFKISTFVFLATTFTLKAVSSTQFQSLSVTSFFVFHLYALIHQILSNWGSASKIFGIDTFRTKWLSRMCYIYGRGPKYDPGNIQGFILDPNCVWFVFVF